MSSSRYGFVVPERAPFETLGKDTHPVKFLGFRRCDVGEWVFTKPGEPAWLCRDFDDSRVGPILIPVMSDVGRAAWGVPDWVRTAKPLTVWLRRGGRGVTKIIGPDQGYIAEVLTNTALGRALLATILVTLKDAGYTIVRDDLTSTPSAFTSVRKKD